jgi:hypothetical protein
MIRILPDSARQVELASAQVLMRSHGLDPSATYFGRSRRIANPATISPIEAPDPTVPVARPRQRENHCPIMAYAGMLAIAVPKSANSRLGKAGVYDQDVPVSTSPSVRTNRLAEITRRGPMCAASKPPKTIAARCACTPAARGQGALTRPRSVRAVTPWRCGPPWPSPHSRSRRDPV